MRNSIVKPIPNEFSVEIDNSSDILIEGSVFSVSNGIKTSPGTSTGSLTIRNNRFSLLNTGIDAGYNSGLQLIIENNQFEQINISSVSTAIDLGGPLAGAILSNNVFLNNFIGLEVRQNSISLNYNTFVNNQTGVRIQSSASATFSNNIFQGNDRAIDNDGVATVHHQINWQNNSNRYNSGQFIWDDTTIWELDPGFVDVSAGDLQLGAGSPARGVGEEAGTDLGAYGGALGNNWADVPGTPSEPPALLNLDIACTTEVFPGETANCGLTAYYSAGYYGDVTSLASWTSSDTNVLTHAGSGRFTANVPGQATISALYGGKEDVQVVAVLERPGECESPLSGETQRASVANDGSEGNSLSEYHAISGDARYIAFSSASTNLIPGDTNGHKDMFVRDLQTGATERVSIASDGTQANGSTNFPDISADGRFVAFSSQTFPNNLVPNDTNNAGDVFIHDRVTHTTGLISKNSNSIQGNGYSGSPSISADGRYVAFGSSSSNLVSGDTNGESDIFIHDRVTGNTERVSTASSGAQANGKNNLADLSADGRYVVFKSSATNLVSGDTNGKSDVFIHDRNTGQTDRISVASDGAQGDGTSHFPVVSADGR